MIAIERYREIQEKSRSLELSSEAKAILVLAETINEASEVLALHLEWLTQTLAE